MSIKKFEEYISLNIVKKQKPPNEERAKNLIKESEEKKEFFDFSMKTIPSEKMRPKFCCGYLL